MNEYPKILNLFKFDQESKQRTTEFSCPEFKYLKDCKWVFTEKIDGMNIRVIFDENGEIEIRGRTDKAQLPPDLIVNIKDMFKEVKARNVTFYGEGYGPGINKGGKYREDKSFRLFEYHQHDVSIPYFTRAEFFPDLNNIPTVTTVAYITLMEAYKVVKNGLISRGEDFYAEGLVGYPAAQILDRYGQIIRVKIKHRDYFGKELKEI